MSQSSTITIRTNPSIKKKAKAFFDEAWITLSTAINLFLSDVVSNQHVNFSLGNHVALYEMEYDDLCDEAKKAFHEVDKLTEDDFIFFDASTDAEDH